MAGGDGAAGECVLHVDVHVCLCVCAKLGLMVRLSAGIMLSSADVHVEWERRPPPVQTCLCSRGCAALSAVSLPSRSATQENPCRTSVLSPMRHEQMAGKQIALGTFPRHLQKVLCGAHRWGPLMIVVGH